jgi:hypothetical protein
MKNVHKIVVREPEGKKHFGSIVCRWEDDIEMNLGG